MAREIKAENGWVIVVNDFDGSPVEAAHVSVAADIRLWVDDDGAVVVTHEDDGGCLQITIPAAVVRAVLEQEVRDGE